jgi:Protein of unknown function (DUF1553)/Protein of unknown function (DUF1549)
MIDPGILDARCLVSLLFPCPDACSAEPMKLLRNSFGWSVWLGVLVCAGGAWAADYDIPPEKKSHWAWKQPVRPALPVVHGRAWVNNPIDAFVLARLKAAGLEPAAPAPRAQLLRRATFDLLGLPPTPAEVDAFVNDRSPRAWEKVLDRLLASPHYGERWGRHWLDLARFAESNGYEFDEARPNAWRYRDYVIRAFNSDKPYDRFIREQLAGDELDPDNPDALVATGFNLLGPDMTDASEQAQRRQNTLNDMTDTAGLAFLGMTIGCARCHDHKFEPIPQTDYYRLQAFFTPAVFRHDLPVATRDQRDAYENARRAYVALVKPTQDALDALEAPVRQKLHELKLARLSADAQAAHRTPEARRTAAQKLAVEKTARLLTVATRDAVNAMSPAERARYKALEGQLKKFDAGRPAQLPVVTGLRDAGAQAPRTFLLHRGELHQAADEVQPGWPIILTPGNEPRPADVKPGPKTTGRRSSLARWMASKDNPLTARVLVNRLWQQHFGRGIVATTSDFGLRGEPPTHPDLLDWLATEFVAQGWSIKQMHKRMLLSATYQQSTHVSAAALAKDPDNHLFSRMNRLRLEGEVIRDSLLAVSGRLNLEMGGPGVFPPMPADALQGVKGWTVSANPKDHVRRSIYIFARRNLRFPFLEAFDLPDSNLSCPKRERSTTAPQALALLNAADVVAAATALAERVEQQATSEGERVTLAYRLALGRSPAPEELRLAHEFLAQAPFRELCRALFNLNEFVYLD